MKKSLKQICLVTVLSVSMGALWQNFATAAVAPVITSLGRIQGNLNLPTRLDIDVNGNLYVSDPRGGNIVRINPYGQVTAVLVEARPSTGAFAVKPDGSVLYVATEQGIAEVDGATGALKRMLPLPVADVASPGWIDLDSAGFIYVADGASRTIKVLDPQGIFQYEFGLSGSLPFASIFAMRVDEGRNEVYVADSLLSGTIQPAVHVYNTAGTEVRTLAAATAFGSTAATFFAGLTFDNLGRAYVLDQHRSEIRIIEVPSRFLSSYIKVGTLVGQLSNPIDITYDANTKRLFVLCADGRIEILGIDGGKTPVKVNVAPGLPRLITPVASSEVAVARPELVLGNAVDPDGDRLTYQVRVLQGEQVVSDQSGIAEGQGSTAVTVSTALTENTHYTWKGQASDGSALSGWTDLQSFWVNAVEEAPSAPALIAPLKGEVLDGAGVLSWGVSSDPDPFDTFSYVLEVSSDSSFRSLAVNEVLEGTSIALSDCTGYPALEDGARYWWRVRAIDNHNVSSAAGAVGSFTYDTTELRVSASLPGASVYLGGNSAFPGKSLGQAPVTLRDILPGVYSIVVERSGAETFVSQVVLSERQNAHVQAALRPALSPVLQSSRTLSAFAGVSVPGAAPFVVDFDNDGRTDLLLGREEGGILFYRGLSPNGREFPLSGGVDLGVAVDGSSPFVVDWDNDGRKDLVVGGKDGSVRLFLNQGSEIAPAFSASALLNAGAKPLQVKGPAVPAVIDYNGDGDKDLVVGTGSGTIILYLNDGEDEAPLLKEGKVVATMRDAAAPFFSDWDADGRRDLLVASGGAVWKFARLPDGSLASPSKFFESTQKGHEAARIFAADLPEGGGKDLIIGSKEQLLLAQSKAKKFTPAAFDAAKDKVEQIRVLAEEEAPYLLPSVNNLAQELEKEDLTAAAKTADVLSLQAPAGGTTAAAAADLGAFLR